MNWGRLDDPAWWWEYALDGVASGIIGGLVTAVAVWLTLRHERKRSTRDAAREAAGRLTATAWSIIVLVENQEVAEHDVVRVLADLVSAARDFQALTAREWPDDRKAVADAGMELLAAMRPEKDFETRRTDAQEAVSKLNDAVSSWMKRSH